MPQIGTNNKRVNCLEIGSCWSWMKWDSSLECVCLRVWEEGVEDVYLQWFPFWRAGANQCSLTLFKSQWESFLALVLLLFHLTFKLYLLGKQWIKTVWTCLSKSQNPEPQLWFLLHWSPGWFWCSEVCSTQGPAESSGCCSIPGQPPLIYMSSFCLFISGFLMSSAEWGISLWYCRSFPFHLKVLEVLNQRHLAPFYAPHRTPTTRTGLNLATLPIVFQEQPPKPNFSLTASRPALPEMVYLGIHHGLPVFLPFTGFTVINRWQKFKGEIIYIYILKEEQGPWLQSSCNCLELPVSQI